MSVYYQKMAEDYRQKYLDLEREYIYLKNGFDYEVSRARSQVTETEKRFNDKIVFEIEEVERKSKEALS